MEKKKKGKLSISNSDYCMEDSPSQFNHPFVKIAFNLMAVLLLGTNFSMINNGYFTSVIMFSLPMLLEYLAFIPGTPPRKVIKKIQLLVLLSICIVCTMGWLGILYIEVANGNPRIIVHWDYAIAGGFSFSAKWLLVFVWLSLLLNGIDAFAVKTSAEQKINGYAATTSTRQSK